MYIGFYGRCSALPTTCSVHSKHIPQSHNHIPLISPTCSKSKQSSYIPTMSATTHYPQSPESHFSVDSADHAPFDLSSYARSMHQHTKLQMEAASNQARRRVGKDDPTNAHATLRAGDSSMDSMDSKRSQASSS
ncbi:hypothetical protein BJ878DRAFT_520185 [Calycina marina]|uniref:Uncharacterized protein n=1 Tax=Calycina marina TaxID=1763456 RepID=A0A9P7YY64_9HELO|nr:hypothetical protein BJ878DRAFT_520185 [Calycina marina]